MKKQTCNPKLVLAALLGAAFLTGCASANRSYTEAAPLSALSFSPVTDPNQLVKWSNDKYLDWNLRSVDTYYFQVPDTGYQPGVEATSTATSTSTYQSAAGAGPGAYQSSSGSYRLIPYRPVSWR